MQLFFITDWPNSYQQSAHRPLQFFIKSFKGKSIKLQTHGKRFISAAGHNKQSLYPYVFTSCDVNNIIYCKELFNFNSQLQEEGGSAEEQPVSNKADAYTIVKGS